MHKPLQLMLKAQHALSDEMSHVAKAAFGRAMTSGTLKIHPDDVDQYKRLETYWYEIRDLRSSVMRREAEALGIKVSDFERPRTEE